MTMLKQCPKCRRAMYAELPKCDACGYPFPSVRVAPDLKVFICALAMIALVIVAIAVLRSFRG